MPDPSFFLPLLLQSAVIPFLVAGAATIVAPALQRKRNGMPPAPGNIPYAAGLAIFLGFLASYFATLHAQWSLLPKQAHDWLPWILLAALPGACFTEYLPSSIARGAARAALAIGAIALTTWPALPGVGAPMLGIVVTSAAPLVWAVWSLLTGAEVQRIALLPLAIISGAAALALMLDSSQLIGQLTSALAAAIGALIILTLLRSRNMPVGAAVGIAMLLLGALLANAYLFAGFPLPIIGSLAGGLLAASIALALGRRSILPVRASCIAAIALCAIAGLVAVALAFKAAQDSGGY